MGQTQGKLKKESTATLVVFTCAGEMTVKKTEKTE